MRSQVVAPRGESLLARDQRRDLELRADPVARLDLLVPADRLVVLLESLRGLAQPEVHRRGLAIVFLERAVERGLRAGVVLELQREQPDGVGGLRDRSSSASPPRRTGRAPRRSCGPRPARGPAACALRSRRDSTRRRTGRTRPPASGAVRRRTWALRIAACSQPGLHRERGIGFGDRGVGLARDERRDADGVARLGDGILGRELRAPRPAPRPCRGTCRAGAKVARGSGHGPAPWRGCRPACRGPCRGRLRSPAAQR